jgi:hypothetical protein
MLDPLSFLLGVLTHDFLARSMKKSNATRIVVGMIFLLVLVDILIRMGAFTGLFQMIGL